MKGKSVSYYFGPHERFNPLDLCHDLLAARIMRREITFVVDIPDDVSDADVLRWAQFHLGERGDLPLDHPLGDEELEAEFGTVNLH